MEDNLPKQSPMQEMMMNGLPGLPNIIKNSMPVAMPQMKYDNGPLAMFAGNYKRKRIAKASEHERKIAENSLAVVKAKFEAIHEVVTFSAKVSDSLGEYEHKKTMRSLEVQEKQTDIYIKTAQAQQIGWEAKLSEMDYQIKAKQFKEMLGDDDE